MHLPHGTWPPVLWSSTMSLAPRMTPGRNLKPTQGREPSPADPQPWPDVLQPSCRPMNKKTSASCNKPPNLGGLLVMQHEWGDT